MRVLSEWSSLRRKRCPLALAVGFFDGIHRGHQRVLQRTVSEARTLGGDAWVLSFATHPLRVLAPGDAPPLLTSTRHRLRLLRASGVDGCLMIAFDRGLASLPPEAFVQRLLAAMPTLRRVLVGANWRFGRGGAGDTRLLARLAGRRGVRVAVVPPVVWKGDVVSSTRIRRAVTAGRLDDAAAMLGRPFSILGTVVRGRAVGRRLGYPTANLDVENEVLPPPGIYAVRARLGACGRALRPGALYIGTRPTFGRPDRCHAELHVLDLNADLYGAEVEVSIVRRLRGDRSFPSADALRRQIARDVERTRTALADGAAKQD